MLRSLPFYASLLDRELSSERRSTNSHVLLYGAIEVHSFGPRGCIASNETLAQDTGISKDRIYRYLNELKRAGWIDYEFDENNHRKEIKPLLEIAIPPQRKTLTPPAKNAGIDNSIDNTSTKVEGMATPSKPRVKDDVFSTSYGNRNINEVITTLSKQTLTGKLDGTDADNRRRAHNLLQKYDLETILQAIDRIEGSFYEGKITSVRSLGNHLNELLAAKKKGGGTII